MKYSVFNYKFNYDNYVGVFNTFSGAIVLFQSNEENIFEMSISDLQQSDISKYKELGIIIDDNYDEREVLLKKRKERIEQNGSPYFRIFTTYACNANCFYCFEKKDNKSFITEKIANDIISFILHKVGEEKTITISWFGGEPLMNHKYITYICKQLKKHNKKVVSFMVSNGSLFSNKIIKNAIDDWNLKHVQITLDGFGSVHNERKKYNSNFDSFEKTIKSIHLLINSNIKVAIRINYDNKNIDSIYRLIDYLKDEFKGSKNLTVYSHFLFDNKYYSSNNNSFLKTYEINSYIAKCGLFNTKQLFSPIKRKAGLCGFCKKDHYAIEPDGTLLKCPDDISSRYGTIYNDVITKPVLYEKWTSPKLPKKCEKCIFEPLCQGGCRNAHFNGFVDTCDVDENVINAVLKDYIREKNINI